MTAQEVDTTRLGPPVVRMQYHVSESPLDLEGIFSGHARTGASGVTKHLLMPHLALCQGHVGRGR
jgi:hypothetical protein